MNFLTILIVVLWNILILNNYVVIARTPRLLPCIKSKRVGKIVGGTDAEQSEMPFIASLTKRGGHYCGATVINNNWLLTAGHCVCSGLNRILKPTQIKAVLGLHKISDFKGNNNIDNDNRPLQVSFKRIIAHSDYECTRVDNDIALLELTNPIQFNQHIKPTCLIMDNNNNLDGRLATVTGWGWTNENQEISDRADILQKANVEIWTNAKCQESYNKNAKNHKILSTQMCAGKVNGGIDSCWADSGGPLMTNDKFLIGIVSTGIGCARPGLPGIYTRVSKYLDWIDETIST